MIKRWLTNLALMGVGVGFAGGLLLLLLTLFPQLRPGITLFTVNQGDIFITQATWIKPPKNPGEILAMYWINWDENGFRIPERQAATYPIIAIGDSYTEAPNVARPWTDVLAEKSGIAVRNLAYRGFGPVEEARVLQRFGAEANSQTVIVGYFEGNDLSNAVNSQANPIQMPWEITRESRTLIETDLSRITERDERYPMQVELNGVVHDIAFLEPYAWILNTTKEDFRQSLNMQITLESYQSMRAAVPDACFIVAYFPGSPHIYLPYLQADDQPILLQKAERFTAKETKKLKSEPAPEMTFAALLDNLPNQREVIQEQIEAAGMIFFDLTPVLQAAASEGQMLYYTYDTHWNQDGHNLVGQAVADFLATQPCN